MAKQQEFDNVTKAWSRVHLLKFILKSFPSRKKRKNLRVFFLPGEKALDYYEVFEKAGINPDNVIGIEREKKYYEKLLEGRGIIDPETEKKTKIKHPFQIERTNAKKYFEEMAKRNNPDENFDIISLDYTGQFTEEVVDTIQTIFENNLLKSQGGVFHTNFYGMQEKEAVKNIYKIMGEARRNVNKLYKESGNLPKRMIDHLEKITYDPTNLSESRDNGITDLIWNIFSRSKNKYSAESGMQDLMKFLKMPINATSDLSIQREYFEIPLKNYEIPYECIFGLIESFYLRVNNGYFVEFQDIFDYISPGGSKMFSNIYFLKQREYLFSENNLPFSVNWRTTLSGLKNKDEKVVMTPFENFLRTFPLRFSNDKFNHEENEFLIQIEDIGAIAFKAVFGAGNAKLGDEYERIRINHKGFTCSDDQVKELLKLNYNTQEISNLCPNYDLTLVKEFIKQMKKERKSTYKKKMKSRDRKKKKGNK